MAEHAPQPRLCPDCEAVAHALAETAPPDKSVFKSCKHNAVIAVGFRLGGTIRSWQLSGPLTDKQADEMSAQLALTLFAEQITSQ